MSELKGRLLALREALDAIIDLVDEAPKTVCSHPLDKRQYTGDTMGENKFYTCGQCGAVLADTESAESIVDRITRPIHPAGHALPFEGDMYGTPGLR